MSKTSIQWTDHSINPIRCRDVNTNAIGHYCQKISPGCANCYASTLQKRFRMPEFKGSGDTALSHGSLEVALDMNKLSELARRKKPTRYFWCDMTDLFGDWVSPHMLDACFAVMAASPQHTHQVLTKRPERMRAYLSDPALGGRLYHTVTGFLDQGVHGMLGSRWDAVHDLAALQPEDWALPLPNVHLGVSAEDQQRWDERVRILQRTPAAIRFVSVEPLLGPIDAYPDLAGETSCGRPDWVIVGGESGKDARACQVEWIRALVEQCQRAGTACFVKQLGSDPVQRRQIILQDGQSFTELVGLHDIRTGKLLRDSKGGDMEEWPEDLRVREFPR